MDLSKAKGESWTPIGGKEKSLPLFTEDEIKKVKPIVKALEGMPIGLAKKLLEKICTAMEQLVIVD